MAGRNEKATIFLKFAKYFKVFTVLSLRQEQKARAFAALAHARAFCFSNKAMFYSKISCHRLNDTRHRLKTFSHQSKTFSHYPKTFSHQSKTLSHHLETLSHQPRAVPHRFNDTRHQPETLSHRTVDTRFSTDDKRRKRDDL